MIQRVPAIRPILASALLLALAMAPALPALAQARGAIHGTVGGGAVEAEAQRRALEAIAAGRPAVFAFPLYGAAVGDASPGRWEIAPR